MSFYLFFHLVALSSSDRSVIAHLSPLLNNTLLTCFLDLKLKTTAFELFNCFMCADVLS